VLRAKTEYGSLLKAAAIAAMLGRGGTLNHFYENVR
jgi:hypothetical protein